MRKSVQTHLWEIHIKLVEDEAERPQSGWKVYDNTPQGLKPVLTRRGNAVKFRDLKDILGWVGNNRQGYLIRLDCYGYRGALQRQGK